MDWKIFKINYEDFPATSVELIIEPTDTERNQKRIEELEDILFNKSLNKEKGKSNDRKNTTN